MKSEYPSYCIRHWRISLEGVILGTITNVKVYNCKSLNYYLELIMVTTNIALLRQKYTKFTYRSYSSELIPHGLEVTFSFEISPGIEFFPRLLIQNVKPKHIDRIGRHGLNNLIFHLGLMEIPSYWKATCSPQIVIQAGSMQETQILFWKDLIQRGMSEFFYTNQIDFTQPDFVKIISSPQNALPISRLSVKNESKRVLVPIGGGKDSLVTFEILKSHYDINWFCLNPTESVNQIFKATDIHSPVIVSRIIDAKLIGLNNQGFLNGHTPFSAYLAFISSACALLFDYQWVAVSNERSSDEGNAIYKGRNINHQYSKSSDFEFRFRSYWQQYIANESGYFSFLRPLYELQIAKIFARFPKYFQLFKSCNKNKNSGSWCGRCPKCLSIALTLLPWTSVETIKNIFNWINPLESQVNQKLLNQMTGKSGSKPFECVTTIEEARICMEFIKNGKTPLVNEFLSRIGPAVNMPVEFFKILKKAYADS